MTDLPTSPAAFILAIASKREVPGYHIQKPPLSLNLYSFRKRTFYYLFGLSKIDVFLKNQGYKPSKTIGKRKCFCKKLVWQILPPPLNQTVSTPFLPVRTKKCITAMISVSLYLCLCRYKSPLRLFILNRMLYLAAKPDWF